MDQDDREGVEASNGEKGAQGGRDFKIPRHGVISAENWRETGQEDERSPPLGASVVLPTRAWGGTGQGMSGRATGGEGPVTGITSSMFPSLHRPGPLPPRPASNWGGGAAQRAKVMETEGRLVTQLVEMGYAKGRAKRAAKGCTTIEDAFEKLERQPEEGQDEVSGKEGVDWRVDAG